MTAPEIHIRDKSTGLLQAVIDDYESLDTVRDLYDVADGGFTLTINRYREAAQHLVKGRVLMPDKDASEAYLIEQTEDETTADGGATDILKVTGRPLGAILAERLCVPPAGQDTDKQISAKAETAMKGIVTRNAGSGASAKRQFPNFSVATDQARGAVISYSANYQPVSDALAEMTRAEGADGGGWEVRKKANAESWEFEYLPGRNLSASVFIDVQLDSAQRIAHLDTDVGLKNHATVGGPDAGGAERTYVSVWSATLGGTAGQDAATEPSGWSRRELYVDGNDVDAARDGNITTLLINKGKTAIRSAGEPDLLEADIYHLGPFRYRRDFDLGDWVTVRNANWGLSQVQRVVRVRQQRDSSQSDPTTTIELSHAWPHPKDLLKKIARQASSAGGYAPVGAVPPYPPVISGWNALYDTITSETGAAVLDKDGILTLGTGNDIAALDAVDATWRLAIGHATYASAPFRVNKAGALFATGATISGAVTATSGTIGGWTVTSTAISNAGGTVTMRGAGNLAFGATPPTAPTTGTGIFIDNTGIFGLNANTQQAYLRASDGVLVAGAGNVTLSSTGISATAGTIGAWTLSATDLRNSGNTVVLRGAGNIAVGSTPPTSPTAGTGVFIDSTGVYGLKTNSANWKLDATTGAMIIATTTTQNHAIALGALGSPPTSATVGTGLWIDATGIYGLASNVQQFYVRASDGKGVFGAGAAVLDASGIALASNGTLVVTGNNSGAGTVDSIRIETELTGTGSLRGLVSSPEHSAGNAGTVVGVLAGATHDSTATLAFLWGLQGSVSMANTGNVTDARAVTGTVTVTGDLTSAAYGVRGTIAGNGVVTDAYGGYFDAAPTGTSTTARGVYAAASGATNNHGVEIAGPGAGANNYAIYSTAAAQSLLSGTLTVNADPAIDLVANGNRIDFDADNDTSIRASADDVLKFELNGTDRLTLDDTTRGDAWGTWTPSWTNLTIGNATVTAIYRKIGRTVHCRVTMVFGSTSSATGGAIQCDLPVTGAASAGTAPIVGIGQVFDTSAGTYWAAMVIKGSTTTVFLKQQNGATGTTLNVNNTSPFTWATGDEWQADFEYEAAA